MADTAIRPIPKQGKLRRALTAVGAWLQALDYAGFDYTLERTERLERELAQLMEELRQSRIAPHGPLTTRQSLLRPPLNDQPSRIEDLSKAMGDINEVVAAIAIASTLDQDQALRRKLRRHADWACCVCCVVNYSAPSGSR